MVSPGEGKGSSAEGWLCLTSYTLSLLPQLPLAVKGLDFKVLRGD